MEGLDNSQMICFEAVLDFVDGMSTRRANRNSQRWPEVSDSRFRNLSVSMLDTDTSFFLRAVRPFYRETAATKRP